MSTPMQSLDALCEAIGLSEQCRTVAVAQGKYKLTYKYDPGGTDSPSTLRIVLNPDVTALIARDSWEGQAQVDGHTRGPNLVELWHWNSLLSSEGRTYSRKSIWYAELTRCETELFVRFDHDSDEVTSKVLKTMDVIMASLQGYL